MAYKLEKAYATDASWLSILFQRTNYVVNILTDIAKDRNNNNYQYWQTLEETKERHN
jgi:hypothetical protein